MPNYWANYKHQAMARWNITLPWAPMKQWVALGEGIVRAGEREHAYRIFQTYGPNPYIWAPDYSYIDYLVEETKRTGILPFFCLGSGAAITADGQNRIASRICYHDPADRIVDADVENMGTLLERLRPDRPPEIWRSYIQHVPPIVLDGQMVPLHDPRINDGIQLRIELLTDIWFPRLMGFLEMAPEDDGRPQRLAPIYNNRALAQCHTPRLNRFLAEMRTLVLGFGGTWVLDEETCYWAYAPMRRMDGVELMDDDGVGGYQLAGSCST